MEPELIELRHADFITIGTIGPPGQRTFFLQAAQDDMVISLVIEKEQATALAIAIDNVLTETDATDEQIEHERLELIHPVRPMFRVGRLNMGHDVQRNMIVIIAEEMTAEEGEQAARVGIWGSREQMLALAREAVIAVASGRPICPLCHEVLDPDEAHVCVRGNGRKRAT
jgi:uncharacterized repeat protein (TIGR03847 family)